MRWLLRLLLTALTFAFVLPLIHGIDFHGGMIAALCLAILFGIMLWVVDVIAIMLTAALAVGTLGLALLWLIPIWILGFWLLPVFALKLVAHFMPSYFTVAGWEPAILGGLVLLLVGMLTSGAWVKLRASKAS
jgi:uncharacterized membrane protein YvlD (DUF360 family)